MGRATIVLLGLVIVLGVATVLFKFSEGQTRIMNMDLSSSSFKFGETIPEEYTCRGKDINPPLELGAIPKEVVSLALVLEDPDSPGGTFSHWVVWNLPPSLKEIPANWTVPAGTGVGTNDFGKSGYGGPCPNSGTHHYHFIVYGLDQKVDLPVGSNRKQLLSAIAGHVVAQGELVGLASSH
jgi:Raf kinase inhibitor-like YbhB/YbcL family protein